MPAVDENVLSALGGGALAVAGMGYAWLRRIKQDTAGDSLHSTSKDLIELYRQHAADAIAKTEQMMVTVDRLAKERNDAVQKVGELQATVAFLSDQVEELNEKLDKLECESVQLADLLRASNEINNKLIEELRHREIVRVTGVNDGKP